VERALKYGFSLRDELRFVEDMTCCRPPGAIKAWSDRTAPRLAGAMPWE